MRDTRNDMGIEAEACAHKLDTIRYDIYITKYGVIYIYNQVHIYKSTMSGPPPSRPILVKFSTYDEKLRFISAARRVKTGKLPSPVYLSDDLTPDRKLIFNAARRCKSLKLITDVWISNGRICIKQMSGQIMSYTSQSAWQSFTAKLESFKETQRHSDPGI